MSNEHLADKSAEEIRAYWTPEKMADAKPSEFKPRIAPKPDAKFAPSIGEQKNIAGYDPTQSAEGSEIDVLEVAVLVPDPTRYPWCTVGKLYFTVNDKNFVGSASAVHNNTLLTAAHSIYKSEVTSKDFLFIPAFRQHTTVWWLDLLSCNCYARLDEFGRDTL